MKGNQSWKTVCIVGFGGHAKSKLLPALMKANLSLEGIVSRDKQASIEGVKIFYKISDAIKNLPKNTLFVIASPPDVHYEHAKVLIEAGRDIFVEKPALTSLKNSVELVQLASKKGVVMVEMLMYLENKTVKESFDELKNETNLINSIKFEFLIPSIPQGTYRNESTLGNSLLSDMACYPLSFLSIAGYDLSNLNLVSCEKDFNQNTIFVIKGKSKNIDINIKVGHAKEYSNCFSINFTNNFQTIYKPFFYGRSGYREIIKINGTEQKCEQVFENNTYEIMFLKKKIEWIKNQKERLDNLNIVTGCLEHLGRQAGFS
tara:strand:+ start:3107 stop:4057 length:951 start_codon:yes stop_codon:yes gene_type:complete